ncbi:hypothetical protein Dimus_010931 [Dionaea muscipula]
MFNYGAPRLLNIDECLLHMLLTSDLNQTIVVHTTALLKTRLRATTIQRDSVCDRISVGVVSRSLILHVREEVLVRVQQVKAWSIQALSYLFVDLLLKKTCLKDSLAFKAFSFFEFTFSC